MEKLSPNKGRHRGVFIVAYCNSPNFSDSPLSPLDVANALFREGDLEI